MATAIMKQKEAPETDDVEEIISKISEESPYKRRPTQKRTWMTVPEMGKLLGLKKTDRYWLVHKNVFANSCSLSTRNNSYSLARAEAFIPTRTKSIK